MFLKQLIGAVSTALTNNTITTEYRLVSAKDRNGYKEFSFSDGVNSTITIHEDGMMWGIAKSFGSIYQLDNVQEVLQVIRDFTVVQGE